MRCETCKNTENDKLDVEAHDIILFSDDDYLDIAVVKDKIQRLHEDLQNLISQAAAIQRKVVSLRSMIIKN